MTWFILGSLLVVLVVGVLVARWWWRLAANIAPYRDELEKQSAKERDRSSGAEIVVISSKDGPSRPHSP